MQESPRRPPVPCRRFHLDSDTYRAALRILSHCVEAEPPVSFAPAYLSPSRQGTGEHESSASSEDATALCGIPGEDGGELHEARDGDGREGNGERAGCVFREEEDGQGIRKVPDVLVNGCPGVADAPHVEGSGPGEVPEEVYDGSRDIASHEERRCGSPAESDSLGDLLADFSSLMEEMDLLEGGEEGRVEHDSLGLIEACPGEDAIEHQEKGQGRTRADDSLGSEPPGAELPTELVCRDPELLPVPSENPRSEKESCTEAQIKIWDSSGPSTCGSGPGEVGDLQTIIPVCAGEDDEMEEGEIPNDGEILEFSFGLESQDGAKQGKQLEERDLAGDEFAEKGNITQNVGGFIAKSDFGAADLIKEKVNSAVHESDQLVATEALKPQKKKKNAEGTKKTVGKNRKEMDSSNKPPKDKMKSKQQKKAKNASTTKDTISENIASGGLRLAEVNLKDLAIQCEEEPSIMEGGKVQQKRKRAPLTESRKEKKKLAKKRKRAETNRKSGVRRLKLEMQPKPRKVIPCSFYQKGRCQKGDSCKFSHDITPETKSMPCSFFARGTCLKGDDCPFDHQLSKYPCHNYVSQGSCIRGDSCLFSHKVPAEEPFATRSVISKTDSTMLSGKQSLQKFMNSNNSSSSVNPSPETTTTSIKSSIPKDSVEQMKLNQPARMPKGICFLSFGKEPSIGPSKQNHDLDSKKGGSILMQKQEEEITVGWPRNLGGILHTSPEIRLSCRTSTSLVNEDKPSRLLQKPPLLAEHNVEVMSCESVRPVGSNTTLNRSKDATGEESRVTDASRILEEFLFSGIT